LSTGEVDDSQSPTCIPVLQAMQQWSYNVAMTLSYLQRLQTSIPLKITMK